MTVKKFGLITGVMAAFLLAGPEAMAGPGTGKGGNGNGGNHGNDQGGGNGNGGGGGTGKGGNGNGGNGGNGGNNNGGGGTGKGGNGNGGNGGNGGTGKGGNGNGGNGGNTPGGGEVVNHCDNRAGNTNKRRCRHKRRYVHVDRKVVRVYRKTHRRVVRKRHRTVTTGWTPGYHCAIDGAPVYNRRTCRQVHRLARKGHGYSFADNSGYASYVTTGAAPRVVVRRKVVTQRRVVVRRKVVKRRRVVVRRPQVVYRQTPQTYVQGGYVYAQPRQQVIVVKRRRHRRRVIIQGQIPQYGNGVTVHYGPVITKQAPY